MGLEVMFIYCVDGCPTCGFSPARGSPTCFLASICCCFRGDHWLIESPQPYLRKSSMLF